MQRQVEVAAVRFNPFRLVQQIQHIIQTEEQAALVVVARVDQQIANGLHHVQALVPGQLEHSLKSYFLHDAQKCSAQWISLVIF